MRWAAPTNLLLAAALLQCYATRAHTGCQAIEYHENMTECRKTAAEYLKFDRQALKVTGLPALVSYRCVILDEGTEK